MKKVILILLSLCVLVACEQDFDELNDTHQRYITFVFNTNKLFADILRYDGSAFDIAKVEELPSDRRVRIVTYCYNMEDSLIYKDVQLAKFNHYNSVKISHLDRNQAYNFVCVADVVRYSSVDYYSGVWNQMHTTMWNDFYLYSDQRSDNPTDNVLGSVSVQLCPENQTHQINFNPHTYNGYCVLEKLEGISAIDGYIAYTVSFKLEDFEQLYLGFLGCEFDYLNPRETIVLPLTLSHADNAFDVKLTTTNLNKVNTSIINVENGSHRPFVAIFDCSNLELKECIYY